MDERELRITIRMTFESALKALGMVNNELDKTEKTGKKTGSMFKTLGTGLVGAGKAALSMLTSLKALVATLAAMLAIRAVVNIVNALAAEMDRTAKLARELNVEVGFLSGLMETVGFSGGSAEQLTMALRKLNTQIGMAASGAAEAKKVFKELGVEIERGGAIRSTDSVLLDVADKLRSIPDAAERARVAAKLFGEEAGPRLLGFLTQGREGLEALRKEAEFFGVVLTDKAAKAAEEYQNSLTRFKLSIKGVRMALVEDLLPSLTITLNGLATFIASNRELILSVIRGIVDTALKIIERAGNLALKIVDDISVGKMPEAFRLGGELIIAIVVKVAAIIRRELTRALAEALAPLVKMGTSLKYIGIEAGTVGKVLNELAHTTDSANASIAKSDERIAEVIAALDQLTSSGGFTTLKEFLHLLVVALNQTNVAVEETTRQMTLLERAMRGVTNSAKALKDGFSNAFRDFKESFTDLNKLTAQVEGQVTGFFNSMQASAAGFFETIYKGGKAKDALKEFVKSMISSLIALAAQLTVIIGLALLFNILTGGALSVAGLANTGAAMAGAGGILGGAMGMIGGAGSGTGTEPGGQTLERPISKSVPPQFNLAPAGGKGGDTYVTIQALDSKSVVQLMSQPENAAGLRGIVNKPRV
jgi:hypothetical protein